MTDKELHRLGRRELLQLLLEQGREAEKTKQILAETETELHQLQETYERLRKRLDHRDEQIHELNALLEAERTKREIELSESGSIAEAALRLNMIFDVAQKAADQYLYNIKRLHGGKEGLPETAKMSDLSESPEYTKAVEAIIGTEAFEAEELTEAAELTAKDPKSRERKNITTWEQEEFTEEEEEAEEKNPKVIQLEHVKAEKIRRAEQEAECAVEAAGAEGIKEAIGMKSSESGMSSITTELKPQKTGIRDLKETIEQGAMEEADGQEIEENEEAKTDTRTAAEFEPKQPVERNVKRGTFFRQMGKFMRFKVK